MSTKNIKLTIIMMFNLIAIIIIGSLLPKTGAHVNRFGDIGMLSAIIFVLFLYIVPILFWKHKFFKIFICIVNGIWAISTFATMIILASTVAPLICNEFLNWFLLILSEIFCFSFLCFSGYWYYLLFNKFK